ncbi:MAG: hypothetical protein J4F41_10260, partial [Alphaproteobacteria bacterium]|nr:hypothetical protein [Alphaproteobacteria bacterium]
MMRFIDLERYPIDKDGPERAAVLKKVRADLAQDGCAILKGFLTPEGIAAIAAEAEATNHHAHRSFNKTNPYFTQD